MYWVLIISLNRPPWGMVGMGTNSSHKQSCNTYFVISFIGIMFLKKENKLSQGDEDKQKGRAPPVLHEIPL